MHLWGLSVLLQAKLFQSLSGTGKIENIALFTLFN
jgi:hypothetical protein